MPLRCPHLRLFAVLASIAVVAAIAPAAAVGAQACESGNAIPATASNRTMVRATLCLLNAERAAAGLKALRLDKRLSKAARRHADDMARRNFFSHTSLDGSSFVDRIRRAGYLSGARYWTVGENLAWATRRQSAPRGIADMWMNSPGHRANILSPSFREVGIGIVDDAPVDGAGAPAATYTTDFGTRR
jgi:uncharacterized protein YkwD